MTTQSAAQCPSDRLDPPTAILVSNTAWSIANFRQSLIHHLQGAGWRVIATAPPDGWSSHAELSCDADPLAVLERRHFSIAADLRLVLDLAQKIKKWKVNVVISFTAKPNIASVLAGILSQVPVVMTVNGTGLLFRDGGMSASLLRLAYRLAGRFAYATVFQNSADLKRFVRRGYVRPERSRITAGSGIDLDQFPFVTLPHNGSTCFVMISRLLWSKGVADYIEAARVVAKSSRAVSFVLAGPIDEESRDGISIDMLRRLNQDGVVQYVGMIDDVRALLARSHAVVLPSRYGEGVPRTLIEAISTGRPVITTATPGCRDTVEHGVNGFLVNSPGYPSLAEAMRTITTLPEATLSQMSNKSRRLAETKFRVENVNQVYYRLISEAVGSRSS